MDAFSAKLFRDAQVPEAIGVECVEEERLAACGNGQETGRAGRSRIVRSGNV
jgi:hypothetical protein